MHQSPPSPPATDDGVLRPPAYVVKTEALILAAVRRHVQDLIPTLSDRQADFLCAPWVHFFTHSALHRLERFGGPAPQATPSGPAAATSDQRAVPGDTLAFMEFFRTPAYREHLDQTLAGGTGRVSCRTALHVLDDKLPAYAHTVAFMSCLPRGFRYLLPLASLGRIRILENKPASIDVVADWRSRAALAQAVRDTLATELPQAAAWISERVAELFPKSLLENLPANLRRKQALPARRALFSADGWQIIDDWKIYALAQKISHGTHWIGAPNAISHGSLAVFWQREFEIAHMDRYLTWGWKHEGAGHVLPFYAPHFAGRRQARPARSATGHGILITSAARPQHLLEYPYTPERFERYLQTQLQLADAAQRQSRLQVTIRSRPKDLGWDLKSMVQTLHNDQVRLEFQSGKFSERLRQSGLHICDNCSTTVVESLWANHPTLVLIDGGYFQIHPEARAEYALLSEAGVLHTNVEALLKQLEIIGSDVTGWWCRPATQHAVRGFLDKQGRDGSRLADWKRALLPSIRPTTPH